MKKFLLACAGVIVCAAAGLFVFYKSFDASFVKPYIIQKVQERTGRALTVDGDVAVTLGRHPSVSLSKIGLSNPDGADDPYLAYADRIDMSVKLWDLLNKRLTVESFSLDGLTLNLYADEQGKKNWDFSAKNEAATAAAPASAETRQEKVDGEENAVKNIRVKNVGIANVGLSYVDKRTGEMYQVFFNHIGFGETEGKTQIDAAVQIVGKTISATAQTQAIADLLSADKDNDFSMDLTGFGATASVDGKIRDLFGKAMVQAFVNVKATQLSQIAALFDVDMPALDDLTVTAALGGGLDSLSVPEFSIAWGTPETVLIQAAGSVGNIFAPEAQLDALIAASAADASALARGGVTLSPFEAGATLSMTQNAVKFSDIRFKSGDSALSGDVSATRESVQNVKASFTSDYFALDKVFMSVPLQAAQNDDARKNMVFVKKMPRKTYFSQENLPFEKLNLINASVNADFKKFIGADGTNFGNVTFSATMKDGVFKTTDFNFAQSVTVQAILDASKAPAKASLVVKTDNLSLPALFFHSGIIDGRAQINTHLKAQGNSVHDLMASMTGDIFIFLKQPVFKSAALENLKLILPPSSDYKDRSKIQSDCVVLNLPVESGRIQSDGRIALQADGFDLQINGEMNLGTEKLNMNVITGVSGEDMLNALSGTLFIQGSMLNPQLNFDAGDAVGKAVSVGLAYLFSGKNSAREMLKSPVPADACKIAIDGGNAPKKTVVTKKKRKK